MFLMYSFQLQNNYVENSEREQRHIFLYDPRSETVVGLFYVKKIGKNIDVGFLMLS